MSIAKKAEKALLDHDEWTLVETTHVPKLATLTPQDLAAARTRLRALGDKERSLAHQVRRASRGKAEQRGGSFPGTYQRPKERKQVFAQAVRRLNSEAERRDAIASREAIVAQQSALLAARRARPSRRPANTPTASEGTSAITSSRSTARITGKRVGSVSQQNKRTQAKRDS